MPVHDLGYRGWTGQLTPAWHRTVVIALAGIRRAWQVHWLRRLLFFAWLPAMFWALLFFMWEQALLHPELTDAAEGLLSGAPNEIRDTIAGGLEADNAAGARHQTWAWLLLSFFRRPQAVAMVLVIGIIAPPLISQDIRSRAFLLYFSKPLSRFEYLLGKLATIWFYLAAISTVPALLLYFVGVLLSPELSVLQATWDLPLRIVGASVVLALPTASVALCLSSMSQESRYAAFAWFAIWILGAFTFFAMGTAEAIHNHADFQGVTSKWAHVSPYHMLQRVQNWVFGFQEFQDVQYAAAILAVATIVSLMVLARRVMAPMRA